MGMCKGNRGNLMQHWTLCECLLRLRSNYSSLHLVTTHSMAPWSVPVRKDVMGGCSATFLRAGRRLRSLQAPSQYESAWESLSVEKGIPYPSSIVFATEVWKEKLSVSLCEADPRTADEIDGWLGSPQQQDRFEHSVLLRGDWRSSLANPLLFRNDVECIYFEMDPMRYDTRSQSNRKSTNPANLYPDDIEKVIQHLPSTIPVILQISSFSTQNNIIPLNNQRQSLEGLLQPAGFSLHSEVKVLQQMASFVFIKECKLQASDLGTSFTKWLGGIE